MKKFKQVDHLDKFKKDLKKLLKSFSSLEEDLETLVNVQLFQFHKLGIDNHGILAIEGLGIVHPKLYKVIKFACKSLKGRGVKSGIRLTYAYFPDEDRIEFIEIYFKADQDNEDKERIKDRYRFPGKPENR